MVNDYSDKTLPTLQMEEPLWSDKKRPIFGLPLSFTRYIIYPDRIIIRRGLLVKRQEEIRFYRVSDHTLRESIFQRLFGVGTIVILSADNSTPKYIIDSIRQPYEVAHLISEQSERERRRVGVGVLESFHF